MEAGVFVIEHQIHAACIAPDDVATFMLSQASEAMAAVVQDISNVCTVRVIMQLHGVSAHGVVAVWKQLVGMSMVIMMHQTQHYSVQCADHLPAQQQTSHK